jgi:hypothetical protein
MCLQGRRVQWWLAAYCAEWQRLNMRRNKRSTAIAPYDYALPRYDYALPRFFYKPSPAAG